MKEYEGFIRKIREDQGREDYDRMLAQIERRVSHRKARAGLALAGALAVLLFAFAAYLYYPARQAGNGEVLLSYVFERESVDGPILDYVFSRHGTIFE